MYQQVLDALYRDGDPEILRKSHGQRLAIKMLSFDPYNIELASRLSIYVGKIDKDYIYAMLRRLPFKGTLPKYIKKRKEPYLTIPYPAKPNLTSPDPTAPHQTSPDLTKPHLTKSEKNNKSYYIALTELFKRLARYYGWSMRELEANMQVLQMLAEDKNWLLQMAKFVGLDRKQMKNLGLSVSKPKVKRRKAKTLFDFI